MKHMISKVYNKPDNLPEVWGIILNPSMAQALPVEFSIQHNTSMLARQ